MFASRGFGAVHRLLVSVGARTRSSELHLAGVGSFFVLAVSGLEAWVYRACDMAFCNPATA